MKARILLTFLLVFALASFVSATNYNALGEHTIKNEDSFSYDWLNVPSFFIGTTNLHGGDEMFKVIMFNIGDNQHVLEEGEREWITDNLNEGYKIRISVGSIDTENGNGAEMKFEDAKSSLVLEECKNAGYSCMESCGGDLYSKVEEYDCGPPVGRPSYCCKEKDIPESETGLFLNKNKFYSGDNLIISHAFNNPVSCSLSIFNKDNFEMGISGKTAESYSRTGEAELYDLFEYLKSRLGNSEINGQYSVILNCTEKAGRDFVLTETFEVVDESRESYTCQLNTSEVGTCIFQGVNYSVEFTPSSESGKIAFSITYNGMSEQVLLNNKIVKDEQDSFVLSNGVILRDAYRAASAPYAGVTFIATNPSVIEKEICAGCILEEKCYPLGYRKNGMYCKEESNGNEFELQKTAEVVCINNFECQSELCVEGSCVDIGFWGKILNWFKNFFN